MRCIACGRVLLLPPAVVVGGYAYGPKCALRAGLLPRKERAHASEALRDGETQDMFEGVPA